MKVLFVMFFGLITLGSVFGMTSATEIPNFVKDVAGFWVNGQINDMEYAKSLEYLISQGIISIPIDTVLATNTNLDDAERAMSIVVHYSSGSLTETHTVYSYAGFTLLGYDNITTNEFDRNLYRGYFLLDGAPSTDKQIVYEMINHSEIWSSGSNPIKYDVKIDLLSGDGTLIQEWVFENCLIASYFVWYDDSKIRYKFSGIDESEIKERLAWNCGKRTLT